MTSRYMIDIQNRKSKIIHVYRNGDKYNRASLVLLRPIEQQKLERIFKAIEEKVTLPYNKPIKRIFSLKGNEIDDPIMIKDQKYYVVGSSENFINTRYGSIIKWTIIGPVKWSKFADVFYEPPAHDDMAVGNKILYRWKNNTTNSARLSTKMTKSMSAYPSDRKPLRNSKMMTLSMDQSKRPISEPSNDMKNVNKINNTENSFFHSSDEKNSSGDNSLTSPKILSNRNHKSMDQFLNDSLKMYQLNDGNSKEEIEIIDQPENDESKSEEKSEKVECNMKNDSPICLINIEENRLENELEDSEILDVHVDRKDNENSDELSENIIEKDLKNTTNGNADDNLKIYDNNIPENQVNENNENSIKSHEIKLEFDKSNLESKNSEMLSNEENESHKIINPNDDVEPNSDEENSSSNENLVKDKSLINAADLEEPIDNHIDILKKNNEEIFEMGNTDFTDNARHSTEDNDKDNIYSDERNIDDESDDSVKIDSERSHTEEENDLIHDEDSGLKAFENTSVIQENEKNVDSLSKEHSQAVQNDDEISENKVDEIMFTDSSNIDKQSLNNSTNDVQLSKNTESNSDQEDGNAINDFSLNSEKREEIKDLHELIKSPCSELNDDDDDIDIPIEEPLEQKPENCNEDTENLKELSDSQIDNYKNELEETLENSGKYSTIQIQSDENYRINNKELNIEDNKNDDDLCKIEYDNEIESSEENDTALKENRGEINDIQVKKNIDSEVFSEENETDVNDNDNDDYSSDKNEEIEIDITNENKFLNENIEFETENQSNKDTEIKEKDHSELCESISTKDENFDKLHELLSKHSRSGSISDHDSSDNGNFDNKFDDSNNNLQQNQNDIVNVKSDSDINPKEQFNRIDLKLSDSSDCFEENTNLPHTFSNQDDHKMNDSLEQFNRIDFMLETPSNCINDKPKVVDSDNEIQNTNTFYESSTDNNNIEQYNRIDFIVDDSIGFMTDKTKSLTDVSENDDSDLNEDDKISNVTKDSMEYIQANIKAETDTTENIYNSNNNDDNNDDEKQESETDTTENIHNSIKNDNDDGYDDKQESKTTEINEEFNENEIKIDPENVSNLLHKELDEDEAALIIQKNFRGHLVRNELTPHTEQINTDEVPGSEMNNNESNCNSHHENVMYVTDDLFQGNKQELDENEAAKIIQKGFREHLIKNDFLSGAKQTDTDDEINSENELNKKEDVENSESSSENEDSERINAAKIIQKNVRGYIVRKDLPHHSTNQYTEDLNSEDEINDSKILDKDHENDKSDASMNLPQLPDENIEQNNAAKIIQKNFRGHLVRKELDHHRKHVDTEEDIESEGEQNRSYEQKDSEYDENDPDVNFSLMKDATNDLNTDEILDDHSQFDNSYPDDAFVANNKL